jgi:DNA-binding transcriptional LysR family regulator
MDRIDALRLMLDVAEAGSFSSVARQRSMATSTVALAVTQLEEEFGARLIIRSTRKLTFTHEGETLVADARRIVADWDAALNGLRDDGPLSGPIKVTATNDFGRNHIRPLLDSFQVRHPGVHVSLLLSDSALDLIGNQIDLAVRSGPLPDSSLRARLLIRGPRLVCASPSYWERAGRPSHPSELVGHNCIILARPGDPLSPWPFHDGSGKRFTVKVKGDRQASDGDVLRQWAIDGRGVILKNDWDIRVDIEEGRLETALTAFTAELAIDLYAVAPPGVPSRRLAALMDFLGGALRKPSLGLIGP